MEVELLRGTIWCSNGLPVCFSAPARIRRKAAARRNAAAGGGAAVMRASKILNPHRRTAILQHGSDRIRSRQEEKAGSPRRRSRQADALPETPSLS